jgi:ATP-binding cassette subfamily C protein
MDPIGRSLVFARDFISVDPRRSAAAAGLALVGAVIEGLGLLLLAPILMVVIGSSEGRAAGDILEAVLGPLWPDTPGPQLALLLGLVTLALGARYLLLNTRDLAVADINIRFVATLRLRLIRALPGAELNRIWEERHGKLTQLINNETEACGAAAQSLIQIALAAVLFAATAIVALVLAPLLGAALLLLVALGSLLAFPLLGAARSSGARSVDTALQLSGEVEAFLSAIKFARAHNLEGELLERIVARQGERREHQLAFTRQHSRSRNGAVALGGLAAARLLSIGYLMGVAAPALLTMMVVLSRLQGPATQLQQNLQLLLNRLPAYERVQALEAQLAPAGPAVIEDAAGFAESGEIVFRGVRFVHAAREGRSGGVQRADFGIVPGQLVWVTGPSGAGKSTLADLLAGLVEPQEGEIMVGGQRLTASSAAAWRRRIAYVPQESPLLHDSLIANLRWGAPDASRAEIEHALRIVGADWLLGDLDARLGEVLGARGAFISGGQRQRIALARALLRRPRLLILDEATGALSEDAEREFFERLGDEAARPTVINITHRTRNLDLAEQLLRVRGGKVWQEAAPSTGAAVA